MQRHRRGRKPTASQPRSQQQPRRCRWIQKQRSSSKSSPLPPPTQRAQQLFLTLFSPTQAYSERLEVATVQFQTFEDGPVNLSAKTSPTTIRIAPGMILFSTPPQQRNGEPAVHKIEQQPSVCPTPDQTPSTFAFYSSGGIAVKKKRDIIISVLDLIAPSHIDPEKVQKMFHFMQAESKTVLNEYYSAQESTKITTERQAATLSRERASDDTLASSRPFSFPTSTPHQRRAAVEYALYADKPYVISHGNDVSVSLHANLSTFITPPYQQPQTNFVDTGDILQSDFAAPGMKS